MLSLKRLIHIDQGAFDLCQSATDNVDISLPARQQRLLVTSFATIILC